jgi:hypothetical protein
LKKRGKMAQIDYSGLILSIMGVIFMVNTALAGILLRLRSNDKKEFEDHKKSVRYSDTCDKVVEGLTKLADERHQDVKDSLTRIEKLIRKNGNSA